VTGPVVYGDDERTLITALVAAFDGRDEAYIPAAESIRIGFPNSPLVSETAIQVDHETTDTVSHAMREWPQTRITCWAAAGQRDDVKDLASLTQGLLEQMPDVRVLIGRSSVATDPDTKNLAVWILIKTSLRGTQLAS
jgi:hypothetical protein